MILVAPTVSERPAGENYSVTRGTFYWRRDSRQLLLGGIDRPNEVGSAWVIEDDDAERKINGGALITHTDAERLATAGEYTLDTESREGCQGASSLRRLARRGTKAPSAREPRSTAWVRGSGWQECLASSRRCPSWAEPLTEIAQPADRLDLSLPRVDHAAERG